MQCKQETIVCVFVAFKCLALTPQVLCADMWSVHLGFQLTIASSMAGEGLVTVSDRRSTTIAYTWTKERRVQCVEEKLGTNRK
eukprot:1158069-Pelagomonas_calceolata.AAC.5